MTLGDHFPQAMQDNYIAQNIMPSAVIKAKVSDISKVKEKRFVIVGIDNERIACAAVYINTRMTEFIKNNPNLKDLQVKLEPGVGREYIDHTCYVDCSQLYEKPIAEILNDFDIIGIDAHIGTVSKADMAQIRSKIKMAKTVKIYHKKKYGLFY